MKSLVRRIAGSTITIAGIVLTYIANTRYTTIDEDRYIMSELKEDFNKISRFEEPSTDGKFLALTIPGTAALIYGLVYLNKKNNKEQDLLS